jgi:hypothetical protein
MSTAASAFFMAAVLSCHNFRYGLDNPLNPPEYVVQ